MPFFVIFTVSKSYYAANDVVALVGFIKTSEAAFTEVNIPWITYASRNGQDRARMAAPGPGVWAMADRDYVRFGSGTDESFGLDSGLKPNRT